MCIYLRAQISGAVPLHCTYTDSEIDVAADLDLFGAHLEVVTAYLKVSSFEPFSFGHFNVQ